MSHDDEDERDEDEDEEDEADRRPRLYYEESGALRAAAWILIACGALAALAGVATDTSVSDRAGGRVENFGLLARQQVLVVGGLVTVGLGILTKILAVVAAAARFHRRWLKVRYRG